MNPFGLLNEISKAMEFEVSAMLIQYKIGIFLLDSLLKAKIMEVQN